MGSSAPERTPQPLRGSIATGELRDNRREGLRRGKVKGKRCCSLEGGGACGQGGGPTDEMKQRARVWAAAHLLLFDLLTIGRVVPRYGERLICKWKEVRNQT